MTILKSAMLMILLLMTVACGAASTPEVIAPTEVVTGEEAVEVATTLATSSPEAAGEPTVVTVETPANVTPAPEGTPLDPSITQVADESPTVAASATTVSVPESTATTAPVATSGGAGEAIPTLAATFEPAGNSLPEIIMVFVREGGIAGFCDTMTVRLTDAVVESCTQGQKVATVTPGLQDELVTLAQQYSSKVIQQTDAPGAADAMTVTVEFYGVGLEPLTPEVEARLFEIGNELISNAASTQ